ncbi:unnamed protein product [Brassicogethes aeneus]|uniref:Uncharacterized protein n=1 Tax=Brassicogethes aeneus TaxID=1431903 RepID=A0A9P0FLF4_BRAAE|nr:unnamed protein product [Brassicogethes aeneus]
MFCYNNECVNEARIPWINRIRIYLPIGDVQDLPTKSHSTCSDGSLLSMDSSEIEEDSFGLTSRQSSKISLNEKKISEIDLEGSKGSIPLNHSAAHHRVSVRPRKTHGAPRRQKNASALPATPEVNEDSSTRIPTPDIDYIDSKVTDLSYKISLTETQLKCSSLPPGLVGPNDPKLSRSKSNAGIQKEEHFEHKEEKSDKSFFAKIIRSSGKRRRSKEKHQEHLQYIQTSQQQSITTTSSSTTSSSVTRIESKPIAAPRNATASNRQRVLPRNLPASPIEDRKATPDIKNLSPIQMELENRIKQRQSLQPSPKSPPLSPKPPRSPPVIVKTEVTRRMASRHSEINTFEEIKPKIELGNVSAFHNKIISFAASEDTENTYKSLSYFPEKEKIVKPVAKSQSFKAPKDDISKVTMAKAASTDSVQVDDSNFKIDIKPSENHQEIVKEVTNKIVNDIDDDFPSKIIKDHGITISGPSHTAVVNITSSNTMDSFTTSSSEVTEKESSKTINIKESQVSVTKIQLKHESTTTTVAKPEFLSKQLNKVEIKPTTNVIFSMKSPKIIEEQSRPKTLNFDSDVNMEIIEKSSPEEDGKPPLSFKFKKNSPKKVLTPETPKKSLSVSLDEDNRSSSQDSLDLLSDSSEGVVLRRKSLAKKKDDEPELMKVFARRSMKIRDSDAESLSQELEEKEVIEEKKVEEKNSINKVEEARRSLEEDRRKSEEKVKNFGLERRKSEEKRKSDSKENIPKEEPKIVEATEKTFKEVIIESTADVTLRNSPSIKNTINNFPRSVSLSYNNTENSFKKPSFAERRVTSNFWSKNEESEEIITKISRKEEKLNGEKPTVEPKNFNQRKAEWEKRAQLAQKNTVP